MTAFSHQPSINTLAIADSKLKYPVNNIYCVGRNYASHAVEMGANPKTSKPFFFSKLSSAATQSTYIEFPSHTNDLQHEVELVIALGKSIEQTESDKAINDAIYALAVGVDLTKRDLQQQFKEQGKPWELAKAFKDSAPLGLLHLYNLQQMNLNATISLSVNDQIRQHAKLQDMIYQPLTLIRELASYFTLEPGDLIFTGTPAGVAQLKAGDRVEASIDGLPSLTFNIGATDE